MTVNRVTKGDPFLRQFRVLLHIGDFVFLALLLPTLLRYPFVLRLSQSIFTWRRPRSRLVHTILHTLGKCFTGLLETFTTFLNEQCMLSEPYYKHLRRSFLRKQLTAKSCELFSQNTPSLMFDSVLNKGLRLSHNLSLLNNLIYLFYRHHTIPHYKTNT